MRKYNASAHTYDSLYGEEQVSKLNKIIGLGFKTGKRLLDVGCGTGLSTIQGTNIELAIGLDISIGMLNQAIKKGKQVVLGDMTKMPFRSSTFESIMINTSFHHAPRKRKTIREILRILRNGGNIGISLIKSGGGKKQEELLSEDKQLVIIRREETTKDIFMLISKK